MGGKMLNISGHMVHLSASLDFDGARMGQKACQHVQKVDNFYDASTQASSPHPTTTITPATLGVQ